MIIELTITDDEGKPFIMDGAVCKMSLVDGNDIVEFCSKVVGNKAITYFKTPRDERDNK